MHNYFKITMTCIKTLLKNTEFIRNFTLNFNYAAEIFRMTLIVMSASEYLHFHLGTLGMHYILMNLPVPASGEATVRSYTHKYPSLYQNQVGEVFYRA